jgi:hypothetical protein
MTDALLELESLREAIPEALQRRKLGDNLGHATSRLADALRQAGRLSALVHVAIELGAIASPRTREMVRSAADKADSLGLDLQTAASGEDLKAISEDYPELISALRLLDQHVRELLRSFIEPEFRPLVAIGGVLKKIEDAALLGGKLQALGTEALDQIERNPPAEQLAPEISRLRAERAKLQAELKAFANHPEVEIFVNTLTAGGATLAQVTPAVLRWLKDHNALEAFSIRAT